MTSLSLRRHFARHHGIEVGLYSYGCFDRWRMPGPMTIGRYCSFGDSVRRIDANHPLDSLTTHPISYEARFGVIAADRIVSERLTIEDDVWIGHNSVILPGCTFIGRGAIIGAGSIVTKNVPAYAVVAGNPAKQLRMRFDAETIAAIEASQWWLLGTDALAEAEKARAMVIAPTVHSLRSEDRD